MKRADTNIERLRNIPLFSTCTKAELALVARRTSELRARPGDVLIREGVTGREFLVIVEGTASVMIGGERVAVLGAGDFCGEIALLDRGPRTATVVADTDLVAQVSSQSEFADVLAGAPNVGRHLLVGLARRLRAADARFAA